MGRPPRHERRGKKEMQKLLTLLVLILEIVKRLLDIFQGQ